MSHRDSSPALFAALLLWFVSAFELLVQAWTFRDGWGGPDSMVSIARLAPVLAGISSTAGSFADRALLRRLSV